MQTHIYQYEILKSLGNGAYDAKDTLSGAAVTLYEYTPDAWARDKQRRLLEEISGDLSSEVFSADASLYLIGRDASKATKDLAELRSQGLFLNTAPPAPDPVPPARPAPQPPVTPTAPFSSVTKPVVEERRSGIGAGAVFVVLLIAVSLFLLYKAFSGSSSGNTPSQTAAPANSPQTTYSRASQTAPPSYTLPPAQTSTDPAPTTLTADMLAPLQRYEHGMLNNDPAEQASAFASTMDLYAGLRNVDNDYVRQDKQAFLDHGNHVTSLSFEDVSLVSATNDTAIVRYLRDVTWENTSGPTHKLIRSLVHLVKTSEGWKIVSEQDFR